MSEGDYMVMHRKMVLALEPMCDPKEAMASAQEDWLADTEATARGKKGERVLDKALLSTRSSLIATRHSPLATHFCSFGLTHAHPNLPIAVLLTRLLTHCFASSTRYSPFRLPRYSASSIRLTAAPDYSSGELLLVVVRAGR